MNWAATLSVVNSIAIVLLFVGGLRLRYRIDTVLTVLTGPDDGGGSGDGGGNGGDLEIHRRDGDGISN